MLELRTKSTQVRSLLERPVVKNCVVAFSFTPEVVSRKLEHKVPDFQRRLEAMVKLQQAGWQVGLRIDPLIYYHGCLPDYGAMFDQLFARLDGDRLHSVSLGVFRLPTGYFRTMERLYPDEKLFAGKLVEEQGMVSYGPEVETELMEYCTQRILAHIPQEKFFPCVAGQ
jgi:spore photoproduct lyase